MKQFTTLAVQSWTLFAISITVISLRLIFRRITLSRFTKFQADDWLMVVVLLPYTASIFSTNQIRTEQSATERRYRYVLEETQIVSTWLVKACLLILYWRILPIRTSLRKRRILQGIAAICIASFIGIQISLVLLWCQPRAFSTSNAHFTPYLTLSLSLSILTTILTMILPIAFIPTPRRILLFILLLLSTLVLASSAISRISILRHPNQQAYLPWYTAESTLSIVFANLPFLTSLVVTAAPARMRSTLAWPRSRQESLVDVRTSQPPLRTDSMMTSSSTQCTELVDVEKGEGWSGVERSAKEDGVVCEATSSTDNTVDGPALPSQLLVPKTRLSGGLAEMGELSLQETGQGWPIYWR